MAADIIGYLRVSTKRQGESGLGLDGQKSAIEAYARQTGSRIAQWYTEVETGKRADRPELAKALAHGRRSKATLVVGKLDRLSRNLQFLTKVMDSGVEFAACDVPGSNRLTLHVMGAVAESEAKAISERTKAALAAAKARGTLLGSARPGHWDGHEEARLAGARKGAHVAGKVVAEQALEAYSDLLPMMTALRSQGLSLQAIADRLNAEGHTTRRGKSWNSMQVSRVLERATVAS
jgi:DNA invertase Pin-like site-specific DNA recombinase